MGHIGLMFMITTPMMVFVMPLIKESTLLFTHVLCWFSLGIYSETCQ